MINILKEKRKKKEKERKKKEKEKAARNQLRRPPVGSTAAVPSSRTACLATDDDFTLSKVSQLFPTSRCVDRVSNVATPFFKVDAADGKRLILTPPPSELPPGCSGLRYEHLKALHSDRNQGAAAGVLNMLRKVVNLALGGYLCPAVQTYLCGGRLIPLNKKDGGIRPLVVRELLRAIVSKLALRAVEADLTSLQPLQVGVG